MIESLIDKQDTFEIVRDQIAGILVQESASQMGLARNAGKDPDKWKLRVRTERSNAIEEWLNISGDYDNLIDPTPIIHIWTDNGNFDASQSNIFERQKCEAVYNIDIYGLGIGRDNPAGGHVSGDQESGLEAQRAYRLVRNMLMSAEYAYLGLRGLVWSRWIQSFTAFQPQLGENPVQHVQAVRLALRVEFNEFSPQIEGNVLEYVSIEVQRAEDGFIYLTADYDYTP